MDARPPSTVSGRLRRLASAALTIAVVATGALALAPSTAQAAGPYGSAFVWLDTPDASMCVVPADHQWNSSSPWAQVNTVCQEDTGAYTVLLPGQQATAGTVQVTAYGSDAAYCKVASWGPAGSDQRIRVRCFSAAGAPTDSQFTLSYTNLSGNGSPLAYVFANQPTTATYTPPVNYQYNSTGTANTIIKIAGQVGKYTVHIPNLAAASAGNVQVTAYGTGSEWCTPWNWGPNGTAQHVQVHCFTATGAPAESKFTLSYVRDGNLLGRSICCGPDGHPTAYALAHNPTAASYVPAVSYRYGFKPTGQITRLSTGRYKVDFGWSGDQGTVHVTATGGGTARCKVESWGTGTTANVLCTTPAGAPTDAIYEFQHVGPFIIG
jgi:hypothetical protein